MKKKKKKRPIDLSLNEDKLTDSEEYNETDEFPAETETAGDSQEQQEGGEGEEVKRVLKKAPPTPKIIPQFEPALFSTPDVMQKVGEGLATHAIMVKGSGKNMKARKILLVKKQIKTPNTLGDNSLLGMKEEGEGTDVNNQDINNEEEEEEEDKPTLPIRETGILSGASKVIKKRITDGEGRSKVIQVKIPTEVRQVVVLNSARTRMNKETLVKVIQPKDPPKEDEKATPNKQKIIKKEIKVIKKGTMIEPTSATVTETEPPPSPPPPQVQDSEVDKDSPHKDLIKLESSKKLLKKKRFGPQKGGDLHKSFEDIVLQRKREETQRKKEEIQRRREEILRKREAIKKRKEMKEMEMKEAMIKKEVDSTPNKEPTKKIIKIPNKVVVVKREVEDGKKNGIEITGGGGGGGGGGKPTSTPTIPSVTPTTTIKVIRKIIPHANLTPQDESPVRRSNRAIKKKTFGDEMLTYDLKEELKPAVKEEMVKEEPVEEEVWY